MTTPAKLHASQLTEADLRARGKSRRPKSPNAGKLDPRLRRIRVMKMLELKLAHNYSRKEIAEEMGLSKMTVDRELSWAKRADIFVELEDRMLSELAPAAVRRLLREVENEDGTTNMDGDANLALKMLEMTGFGPKGREKGNDSGGGDTLESYIAKKRKLAELRERSVDGQLLGDEAAGHLGGVSGYLPPAPAGTDAAVGDALGESDVAEASAPTFGDGDGEANDVDGDDAASGAETA